MWDSVVSLSNLVSLHLDDQVPVTVMYLDSVLFSTVVFIELSGSQGRHVGAGCKRWMDLAHWGMSRTLSTLGCGPSVALGPGDALYRFLGVRMLPDMTTTISTVGLERRLTAKWPLSTYEGLCSEAMQAPVGFLPSSRSLAVG